jgi:Tol biopolymer transport system component
MNQNGGAVTDIANNSVRNLDPATGSNGNWIAFSTDRDGNLEIYVVRPQGGNSHKLTRIAIRMDA